MATKREKNDTLISKFRLQSLVRELLPDSRTSYCMKRQVSGSTSVHKHKIEERSKYTGLMTCGSRWVCPVCSIKKNSQDANDIKTLINSLDCELYLITYTIQHNIDDKLSILIRDLNRAINYMRSGSKKKRFDNRFNVIGHIRTLEIRYSKATGFHPHIHELLITRKGTKGQEDEIDKTLKQDNNYCTYLQSKGYLTNNFTVTVKGSKRKGKQSQLSDYLTKCAIELEMSLGSTKKSSVSMSQFQILDLYSKTFDPYLCDVYQELFLATSGKQQIRWSKGLKGLLPDNSEGSEIEMSDQWRLLAKLDHSQWMKVCEMGARAILLIKARESTNDNEFIEWLNELTR